MTLELTLLLALVTVVILKVMAGDSGPIGAFQNSAGYLGARVEHDLSSGRCFQRAEGQTPCQNVIKWTKDH